MIAPNIVPDTTPMAKPLKTRVVVASLGFLPMAFSTGMGAEVQRPLATVVIGGVIGAMVMSLLVLRVLYVLFQPPGGSRRPAPASGPEPALIEAIAD